MAEIKASKEEFESAALKFTNASDSTTKLQQNIKTATEALLEVWKGTGKDAFNNEYQIICKNMLTYSEVLKDISKELTDIGKQFEEQDADISNELLKGGNTLKK